MKFRKHIKHKALFKVSTTFVLDVDGFDDYVRVVIPNYIIKCSACVIQCHESTGRIHLREGSTVIRYRPEHSDYGYCVAITYPGTSIYWTKIRQAHVGPRIAEDMSRIMRQYSK